MWTVNFQMFSLDLEKAEEPEVKLPTSIESSEKHESSRKSSISALMTMPKPWLYGSQHKLWKILKEMELSDQLTCLLRNLYVKKHHLEPDLEQWTGKEYVKAVYCHPAYLTYMQSTSCEMPGWMKHKLELRLWGEISITSDMQMTPPLWQKEKKN